MKELARSRRLKRRTQNQRLGEMPNKTNLWSKLFKEDIKKAKTLNRVRTSIKRKIIYQINEQRVGMIREEKVRRALQALKDKKKIMSFLSTAKFSFADLIEGIDFMFIYVNGTYQTCRFSVTGYQWAKEHEERHPEVPVIAVKLQESRWSIERKILNLIT